MRKRNLAESSIWDSAIFTFCSPLLPIFLKKSALEGVFSQILPKMEW